MAKKANKKRKKPSAPQQAATDKYKKYAAKPEAPEKSKKPLFIALAAVASVCAVFIVLLLAGVFSANTDLNGTWEFADMDYKLIIDGDRAANNDGEFYDVKINGDKLTLTYESGYSDEYLYSRDGDTLSLYAPDDESMTNPIVVFTRTGDGVLPESSSAQSSRNSSEESSEDLTYDLDDGIPDFEQLGIANDLMREGVTYGYTTKDYADESKTVSGTLQVTGYEVTALTARAKMLAEEQGVDLTGYESRTVTVHVYFESTTPSISFITGDYYYSALFEDNFAALDISADGEYQYASSKAVIDGKITTVYFIAKMGQGDSDEVYDRTDTWEVLVPEGYDGVCIGYLNRQIEDMVPDNGEKPHSFDYYQKGEMYYFRCA
ncbi:MAG: hypothetical protein IKS88_01920 [Clostridia bacterium]|nr:hypothetical protein [Clostridia bacterium]